MRVINLNFKFDNVNKSNNNNVNNNVNNNLIYSKTKDIFIKNNVSFSGIAEENKHEIFITNIQTDLEKIKKYLIENSARSNEWREWVDHSQINKKNTADLILQSAEMLPETIKALNPESKYLLVSVLLKNIQDKEIEKIQKLAKCSNLEYFEFLKRFMTLNDYNLLYSEIPAVIKNDTHLNDVLRNTYKFVKTESIAENNGKTIQKDIDKLCLEVAEVYNKHSSKLYDTQKYKEAIDYLNKAINIYELKLPANSEIIAESYEKCGLYNWKQNENQKAIDASEKAVSIHNQSTNPQYLKIANLYNYARIYSICLGNNEKAIQYGQKALAMYEKKPPEDKTVIGDIHFDLGLYYAKQEDYENAYMHTSCALNVYNEVHPKDHVDIARACHHTGLYMTKLKDYKMAVSFYLPKAAEIYEKNGMTSDSNNVKNLINEYKYKCN